MVFVFRSSLWPLAFFSFVKETSWLNDLKELIRKFIELYCIFILIFFYVHDLCRIWFDYLGEKRGIVHVLLFLWPVFHLKTFTSCLVYSKNLWLQHRCEGDTTTWKYKSVTVLFVSPTKLCCFYSLAPSFEILTCSY